MFKLKKETQILTLELYLLRTSMYVFRDVDVKGLRCVY